MLLHVGHSLVARTFGKHVEDAAERLDVHQLDLIVIDPVLLAEGGQPLDQLADQFHPREPAARHHECQQVRTFDRVELAGGLFDRFLDMVADTHGILDAPQIESMLFHSGDVEVGCFGSGADEQLVVRIGTEPAFQDLFFEINGKDLVMDDVDSLTGENPVERNLHRPFLDRVAGHFVQLGHEDVLTMFVDEGDLDLILHAFERFVQPFRGVDTSIASTQDHDALFFHSVRFSSNRRSGFVMLVVPYRFPTGCNTVSIHRIMRQASKQIYHETN